MRDQNDPRVYTPSVFDRTQDAKVRAAAFEWLETQVAAHGDVLPFKVLEQGFDVEGSRVPLLSQQGIFKPRVLDVPLSIRTAPDGPYKDSIDRGVLRYRYRGTDPDHRDNQGLRFAMKGRIPLVYLHRLDPGKYVAAWPVFVVGDDPASLTFTVAIDDAEHSGLHGSSYDRIQEDPAEARRRQYVTVQTLKRIHQRAFRERVLTAYRRQCAFCRLKHEELLDAAHIVPDTEPEGEPTVPNGLALCKLHHGAFDGFFVGVRPDGVIQVRRDILEEVDGPTLVHAIQALHDQRMHMPLRAEWKPSTRFLEIRFERFLRAPG